MSDISGMDNATASRKPEITDQPDSEDQSSRNWEERLSVARAEREKVLKAKGKSLSKPVMKRPSFMDEDPSANWALEDPEPDPQPKGRGALSGAPPALPDPIVAGIAPANQQNTIQEPSVARSNSISVSWVVIVAFACFFGLGSGIVLSVGAVVAMGWVSLSDLAPQRTVVETQIAPQAPDISTIVFKPLSPPVPHAARISLRYASITPVAADMSDPPVLYPAFSRDAALQAVQSPAPRLGASGMASELVSRLDFQPAAISVTFATPLPVAASPTPFGTDTKGSDVLPVVLEKSDIRPLTNLADLSAPAIERATVQMESIDEGMTRPLTGPALFKSVPGTVPQIPWARLDKPDIFNDAIASFSSDAPLETKALVLASLAEGPPQRSVRADAPVNEADIFSLPIIGQPHPYNPTLATRLGMTADAAARINLVTFAPANVSDDKLKDHAEMLDATGFAVSAVNRVNFKVSRTHVRYYRNGDEGVARALAEEVGGIARNFSTARNRPPAGQVEVWMEGNRIGVRSASTPRQSVSAAQRRAAAKAQLENRLVNSLRRGEHLGDTLR